MHETLNDFVHQSAALMFDKDPSRQYIQYENMLRESVEYILSMNSGRDFVRLPGAWIVTRTDHGENGVIWKLQSQVLTYVDTDNDQPNKIY